MRIEINGGKTFIADKQGFELNVVSGEIVVFIVPVTDGTVGRRVRIYDAKEGESIPSLIYDSKKSGSFRFLVTAVDKAVLEYRECENIDSLCMKFAEALGVKLFSVQEFDEQIVDLYDRQMVKEEGFIYSSVQKSAEIHEENIERINRYLDKKSVKADFIKSGNLTYDLINLICISKKIKIAPYEKVKTAGPGKINIHEIGELSHFAVREVILEDGWYRRDCGAVLAYTENGRKPVACIQKGAGTYYAFENADSEGILITEEYAKKLSIRADVIYRPFPEKALGISDVMMFGYSELSKRDMFSFGAALLIGMILAVMTVVFVRNVFDTYIPIADLSGLFSVGLTLVCVVTGNLLVTIAKRMAVFRGMSRMSGAVQNAAYDRVFKLPASFFRKYDSTDVAGMVFEISYVFKGISDIAVKTVMTVFMSIAYLFVMTAYGRTVAGKMTVYTVLTVVIIGIIEYFIVREEPGLASLNSELQSRLYQFISGISKIRISGSESRAVSEYFKPFIRSRMIMSKKNAFILAAREIKVTAVILLYIVLYAVSAKNTDSFSTGRFVGFAMAYSAFAIVLFDYIESLLKTGHIVSIIRRIQPILKTEVEYDACSEKIRNFSGEIELSNVDFAYDQGSENVLNNLSLHIKPGEYVGIVGASGSGKSTILKLLLGFEKPSRGRVYYDGKDLNGIDKKDLRKKFGVVLQDGGLISGSILDNIVIMNPDISQKRVNEIIEAVGLTEDINAMPMGVNTMMNETGSTISGGQKQRILIARALVNSPKVIFFDEATSSLDNVSQAAICNTLNSIQATKVVIAHRLSTVMNCDRIIVLNNGNIEEEGTYQELMEKNGLFSTFAERQII